jgi:nitroimidazol reductase NimA-like FMN-containing flavoprotein (pyridoxamine 5'-phosphate oxidase superfamily)
MSATQAQIDAFLATPGLLGRLATVSPQGMPHVVPVWYLWEEGCLWIHSFESTRKVRQLRQRPACALVVDVTEKIEGLTAVLIEGQADLVTAPRSEVRARAERVYRRYLSPEELAAPEPQSWLDSEEGLILKIVPRRIIAW